MPCRYTFIYINSTLPDRHVAGFPKFVSQFVVSEMAPHAHHVGLLVQYDGRFTVVGSQLLADNAIILNISNMLLSIKKLTNPNV